MVPLTRGASSATPGRGTSARGRPGRRCRSPGEFSQLEVPQLVHFGGAWRVLFCATQNDHSAARLGRAGVVRECGTHYLTAHEKFGDYRLSDGGVPRR